MLKLFAILLAGLSAAVYAEIPAGTTIVADIFVHFANVVICGGTIEPCVPTFKVRGIVYVVSMAYLIWFFFFWLGKRAPTKDQIGGGGG